MVSRRTLRSSQPLGSQLRTRGIREASLQALMYNATLDIDLVEALNPADCGDVTTTLANAEKTFASA